ncbi:hypothetical protein RHMOL_Rhmol03G0167300 [Rhododendron molle]|uniref:Uncharacterized protein n=1 Tax=Rhododendron molle TaxID=49168 RepID=A0ACC0PFH2_RHOML|nr:hypothetical protein RHMOL_Rhmol03G0167300 [Rhododendron molle]
MSSTIALISHGPEDLGSLKQFMRSRQSDSKMASDKSSSLATLQAILRAQASMLMAEVAIILPVRQN